MNKQQAHELLQRQKEQRNVTALPSAIDQALFLTGDLGRNALEFGAGMDKSLQLSSSTSWQSQGKNLVADTGRFYGSQAWFDIHNGLKKTNEQTENQT
jgi:hypothetical protein